jgi:hypothetical protein
MVGHIEIRRANTQLYLGSLEAIFFLEPRKIRNRSSHIDSQHEVLQRHSIRIIDVDASSPASASAPFYVSLPNPGILHHAHALLFFNYRPYTSSKSRQDPSVLKPAYFLNPRGMFFAFGMLFGPYPPTDCCSQCSLAKQGLHFLQLY